MNYRVYIVLFVINFLLLVTNILGNYTPTIIFASYLLSTFFLLFSADEHPLVSIQDQVKIKNTEIEIDKSIQALESIYREKKRNVYIYINVGIYILSSLVYFLNSQTNSINSSVVIIIFWLCLIISIFIQIRFIEKNQVVKLIFEYIKGTLKVDTSREIEKVMLKYIDGFFYDDKKIKSKAYSMLLDFGFTESRIEEINSAINFFIENNLSFIESNDLKPFRNE